MLPRKSVCTTLILCCVLQGCRARNISRSQRWQADFNALATDFPRHQIDPWGRLPQADWRREMQQLAALPIDQLSDADIALRIERVLARYHDGHIAIRTDSSSAEALFLPVRLRWFPSGIFVSSAVNPSLRGAQLLRLGGLNADQVLTQIAPWVSIENDAGLHAAANSALSNATLLLAAGVVDQAGTVPLVLRLRSGEETTLSLPPQRYADITWPALTNLPPYRQSRTPENWVDPVIAPHALYLRYATCHDKDGSRRLAEEIEARLKSGPALLVLVDLRGNSGGDSAAFSPILRMLKRSHLSPPQLRVLVDRNTFSSAFRNAVELKELGAIVIGESPSQRPVYTGNVDSFALPYSHLKIRYTTKWSLLGPPGARELSPDVPLQPTPEQYYKGEDPVLERALSAKIAK